ncbi:hypothetical protein [Gordonia sp. (in: high G+C Gram-positive bacteria)]|uniref:hypothetical protein n=1 Tax=Gordonia sp. (in: high G+C Gram-positive bacteria) TaxID=84139 RepID=UPI003C740A2C
MSEMIELHIKCKYLPVSLAADIGKAMSKLDPGATFDSNCEDDCYRFVFRAAQ